MSHFRRRFPVKRKRSIVVTMKNVPPTPFETTGHLDIVTNEDGVLRIEGWAAAFDGRLIDGFQVYWDGHDVTALEVESGLRSPDVAAAFPDLPLAGSCRFCLSGRAGAADRDLLVWVLPTSGGRTGHGLYRLIEPLLPVPPEAHIQAIGGGFQEVAVEMLGNFIERAGLRPDERVLDVGCGVGRMAYALAYYLNAHGRYDGFDVMRPFIEWASKNLGDRLPRFRFHHVDVYNNLYNPNGVLRAETFSFPFADAVFDFVFLTSVFTHMHGPGVLHYLEEITRVLAPNGRIVVTAFVLTPEAKDRIQRGLSTQGLVHPCGDAFVADLGAPEGAVGFEEEYLVGALNERGLRVAEFCPGSWCGRSRAVSYQDLLVLEPEMVHRFQLKPRRFGLLDGCL
jgi:SAM-dependent methyltransferase